MVCSPCSYTVTPEMTAVGFELVIPTDGAAPLSIDEGAADMMETITMKPSPPKLA